MGFIIIYSSSPSYSPPPSRFNSSRWHILQRNNKVANNYNRQISRYLYSMLLFVWPGVGWWLDTTYDVPLHRQAGNYNQLDRLSQHSQFIQVYIWKIIYFQQQNRIYLRSRTWAAKKCKINYRASWEFVKYLLGIENQDEAHQDMGTI